MTKDEKMVSVTRTTLKDRIRRLFKRGVSFIRGCRNKHSAVISESETIYEKYIPIQKPLDIPSAQIEPIKCRHTEIGRSHTITKKMRERACIALKNGSDPDELIFSEIPNLIKAINLKISLIKSELQEIDDLLHKKTKPKIDKSKYTITTLKCKLCKAYFIKPVLLKCSHIFCDWCIKNHLSSNKNCPDCDKEIVAMWPLEIMQELVEETLEETDAQTKHEYKLMEYTRAFMDEKVQYDNLRNKVPKVNGFKAEWL